MLHDPSMQAISFSGTLRSVSAPVDADWQRVYPPTYKQGNESGHLYIGRPDPEGLYPAVLIDSVQSFAHRVGAVLQDAGLGLPEIRVTVGELQIPLHQLPHRVYDAILRDALLDDVPWRQSSFGKKILSATTQNADALWQHAPLTLLFGGWDSHAGAGTRATKLARALAVEIIGRHALPTNRGAVRFDPLGIASEAGLVYLTEQGTLTLDPALARRDAKPQRPSEVGHGNVPDFKQRGALVKRIDLMGALSLARLRRYRFSDPHVGEALAWLGIYGVLATLDSALDLRSGCELELQDLTIEARRGLKGAERMSWDTDEVRTHLERALERCSVKWWATPLELNASPALEKIFLASHGE